MGFPVTDEKLEAEVDRLITSAGQLQTDVLNSGSLVAAAAADLKTSLDANSQQIAGLLTRIADNQQQGFADFRDARRQTAELVESNHRQIVELLQKIVGLLMGPLQIAGDPASVVTERQTLPSP